MSSLKHISKNFLILIAGNVLSQALFFYGILIIAASTSPEIFGRFSFAQAFTLFFIRLSELGLETLSIRRIVLHDDPIEVVSEYINARLVFCVIIFVISYLLLLALPVSSLTKTTTAICLLAMFGNTFLLEWFFQAKEQMHIVGLSRIIRAIIFTLPLVFFRDGSIDDLMISIVYVLSFFVPSIIISLMYFKKTSTYVTIKTFSRSIQLLKQSAPIGISATLMQIPFNIGTIIIGLILTAESIGIYSAGYRISLVLWSFGIVALYNAIFPTMTSFAADGRKFDNILKKLSIVFSLFGGLLVITAIAFSLPVIHTLYQGKYDSAVDVLQISLFTVSIILARTAIEYSLLAQNRLMAYLKGMMFVSALYLIGGYIGTSQYGIIGMVYAAAIAEVCYTGYILSQLSSPPLRLQIVQTWGKIIAIVLIAASMFQYAYVYNQWIAAIIMVAVYLSATFYLFKNQIRESVTELFFQ